MKQPVDIFLSHDWPRGIYNYGDTGSLIRRKRFLAEEIAAGTLGSMPTEELLYQMKPTYWFSAHLHVKFAALINHAVSRVNYSLMKKLLCDTLKSQRSVKELKITVYLEILLISFCESGCEICEGRQKSLDSIKFQRWISCVQKRNFVNFDTPMRFSLVIIVSDKSVKKSTMYR
jgi:hypothetical protein